MAKYNHLNIKNIFKSVSWKSISDTETLLELIDFFGVKKQ